MLVSVERYRAITGDETTAASACSALIEEATEELAEILDRPLELAEHTERMRPTRDGKLWPRATPITVAADYTIDGLALLSAFYGWPGGVPFPVAPEGIEVTYTGGWTDETVPTCIARDIAMAAWLLGQPLNAVGISAPVGVKSVSVGDQAVTFDDDVPGNVVAARLAAVWSRRTLSYRYRVERGV
jgi:hypothetical protein